MGAQIPDALHDVVDAFVVEHARPHAPQFWTVSVGPQPPELEPLLDPLLDPLLELLLLDPLLLPLLLLELLLPELELLLLLASSPPSSPEPLLDPELLAPELDALPLDDPEAPLDPLLLAPELDAVPELLAPDDPPLLVDEPAPLLVLPPLDVLPEPLDAPLLDPVVGWPPVQACTVVDVSGGAVLWHVCPEGQPCDPSQNAEHTPAMQMRPWPHAGAPCVETHACPWMPGPAVVHP